MEISTYINLHSTCTLHSSSEYSTLKQWTVFVVRIQIPKHGMGIGNRIYQARSTVNIRAYKNKFLALSQNRYISFFGLTLLALPVNPISNTHTVLRYLYLYDEYCTLLQCALSITTMQRAGAMLVDVGRNFHFFMFSEFVFLI